MINFPNWLANQIIPTLPNTKVTTKNSNKNSNKAFVKFKRIEF